MRCRRNQKSRSRWRRIVTSCDEGRNSRQPGKRKRLFRDMPAWAVAAVTYMYTPAVPRYRVPLMHPRCPQPQPRCCKYTALLHLRHRTLLVLFVFCRDKLRPCTLMYLLPVPEASVPRSTTTRNIRSVRRQCTMMRGSRTTDSAVAGHWFPDWSAAYLYAEAFSQPSHPSILKRARRGSREMDGLLNAATTCAHLCHFRLHFGSLGCHKCYHVIHSFFPFFSFLSFANDKMLTSKRCRSGTTSISRVLERRWSLGEMRCVVVLKPFVCDLHQLMVQPHRPPLLRPV